MTIELDPIKVAIALLNSVLLADELDMVVDDSIRIAIHLLDPMPEDNIFEDIAAAQQRIEIGFDNLREVTEEFYKEYTDHLLEE